MLHRACCLCDADDARLLMIDDGQRVVRCSRCGFIYCNPIPTLEELQDYYATSYRDVDGWWQTFRHDRFYVFREGLKEIRRYCASGTLLDVGCSLGLFLSWARQAGFETAGVELSPPAARFARERLGLNVHCGTLQNAPFAPATFDVVTFWDVLEHVADPLGDVRRTRELLKPGGLLVVRVPNVGFHLLRTRLLRLIRRDGFTGLDARNHLNHFTARTLRALLERAGFRVLKVKPGTLNIYGNLPKDAVKFVYWHVARIFKWTFGVDIGNILEAYAVK
ncbi:MAG: class I SAM-dependent methyltransferase [Abditibacteriales bacterium]|nr:class I SAM-dependent methyltransferase [Abditibacteriales bacterium]MDW8367767.1 class I SAM-dependent methyltransferase [Abditibacteriales bacterium]